MKIPKTKKENIKEEIHGVEVNDPYRWLEEVENSEVQKWLDKQEGYSENILKNFPHREELKKEFEKLYYQETIKFPKPRGNRYFYRKRKEDEDLSVLYCSDGLDGEPQVLVNPNKISEEKGKVVSLTGYKISKDGTFINYLLSEESNDRSAMYVMNVETGEKLEDEIPAEFYPYGGSWSFDNSGFWYMRRKENVPDGEEKFHRKVYYHKLGNDFRDDELIFGKDIEKEDIPYAFESHDGSYVTVGVGINSEEYERSEVFFFDPNKSDRKLKTIVKGIKGDSDIHFLTNIHRDYIYILTNYNAPKWKIMRVSISDVEKGMDTWEEVIPESNKVIKGFSLIRDKMFVKFYKNVYSQLYEYTLEGELSREISLPTLGSCSSVISEPESSEGFFAFASYSFPKALYRIDFDSDSEEMLEQVTVHTDMDIDNIETEQVWFKSKDGTSVPMFLVHKKDIQKNGSNPTLLNGYGGFGISSVPFFRKDIIPFLKRGGVFAVANIRGGGEFGEEWHKAGTKKQKQNVFDDFIAAAEWLIENNYTSKEHLGIRGGSNGGLLVGAVMTQRPELISAVNMAVPVVDMIRFHKFHGGRHWIPDYGSSEDPDMVEYLLGYSPYHNVKDGVDYPATMIETGDKDDRVHPGQAFKMAARLQEANSSDEPIFLHLEREVGHGGAADISRFVDKQVDKWSFFFKYL